MARKPDHSSLRVDIISIGTLGRNILWSESQPLRTAHATTSLVRGSSRNILVDPGLPAAALGARIFERTGLSPQAIDVVFLTNFRPAHRAGIALFSSARHIMNEPELQFAREQIEHALDDSDIDPARRALLENDLRLLERFEPAEDQLARGVDLFPLPGPTPGTCGLLVAPPLSTTLIAGDAVPSLDHFLAGQILPDAHDLAAAQESFREVLEIADLIVPGYDNIFVSPRGQTI